jgi:predicted secreted protein
MFAFSCVVLFPVKGIVSKCKKEFIVTEVNSDSVQARGPNPWNMQASKQGKKEARKQGIKEWSKQANKEASKQASKQASK